MATLIEDVRILVGGADLATSLTKVDISTSMETKDVTTFRVGNVLTSVPNAAKLVAGGQESSAVKLSGNSSADATAVEDQPDDLFWANVGEPIPLTYMPDGDAAGDLAYFAWLTMTKNATGGAPGDVWSYDIEGAASAMSRGIVAQPVAVAISDGFSDVFELPAVPEGQRVRMAAHVLAATGTSIKITLQSDSTEGFSSPTEQLDLGTFLGKGGYIDRTDGTAITDTFWRVAWDVTLAGDEGFVIAAAVAID